MTKPLSPPPWAKDSPWRNEAYSNIFKTELRYVEDPLDVDGYRPHPLIQWVHKNKGFGLLLRAMASFSPLFPVYAYRNEPALWTSPPPSGFGNTICIVMGHDSAQTLRLVGGNCFTRPRRESGETVSAPDFFEQFDRAPERTQQDLVRQAVSLSMSIEDEGYVQELEADCVYFHTMPVYLSVLRDKGSIFSACPAIVDGVRPFDFSYEHFGEVK